MRRYRSALILLLILALMTGGYYFYTVAWPMINPDAKETETTTAASSSISIVDRKSDEIEQLTVNHLSEEYVAVKEKVMEKAEGSDKEREVTKWKLVNRNDIKADSSKLSTAAVNFCVITASKIVEESASDLGQYGLGKPDSAKAVGKFSDGAQVTLEIGDKNPTSDGYYIRKDGGNTVYLGSTYSSEKIMIKKTEIADLKLFSLEEADIARMLMKRGGALLFEATNVGEYKWELDHPVIAPLNTTAQGMIFPALADVSATEYVELGAKDLGKYGLDNPKYSMLFELRENGGTVELILGDDKVVRTSRYAMLGGTRDVFVVNITNFTFLDKPVKEFVDAFAYIISINDVSHIQADFDGNTVLIDIFADMDSEEEDVFIMDGVDVSNLNNEKDRSLFRIFYQALIGVTIYDVEPDSKPSGEAEITFLYELEVAPHRMLVEFVPKDDRLYYVFRNKEYAGITVEKRIFDRPDEGLRDMYAKMKEAMAKAAAEAEEAG